MSPLRLTGSTSGYSQIDAPAVAGDQLFTLPGTGGTLDRLNRAGNILQVVSATTSTYATNSTQTYADTNLSASITPSSTSSKVLIFVNQNGLARTATSTQNGVALKLLKGSTELALFANSAGYTSTALYLDISSAGFSYLDSPATVSLVTYKTQFANFTTSGRVDVQAGNCVSSIILLEVAA